MKRYFTFFIVALLATSTVAHARFTFKPEADALAKRSYKVDKMQQMQDKIPGRKDLLEHKIRSNYNPQYKSFYKREIVLLNEMEPLLQWSMEWNKLPKLFDAYQAVVMERKSLPRNKFDPEKATIIDLWARWDYEVLKVWKQGKQAFWIKKEGNTNEELFFFMRQHPKAGTSYDELKESYKIMADRKSMAKRSLKTDDGKGIAAVVNTLSPKNAPKTVPIQQSKPAAVTSLSDAQVLAAKQAKKALRRELQSKMTEEQALAAKQAKKALRGKLQAKKAEEEKSPANAEALKKADEARRQAKKQRRKALIAASADGAAVKTSEAPVVKNTAKDPKTPGTPARKPTAAKASDTAAVKAVTPAKTIKAEKPNAKQ